MNWGDGKQNLEYLMASKKNPIEEILSSGKQIQINDIEQLSGVSPTTVSRVLNSRKDLVSQTHPFKNNQRLVPYKIREQSYDGSRKSLKEP